MIAYYLTIMRFGLSSEGLSPSFFDLNLPGFCQLNCLLFPEFFYGGAIPCGL